MGRTDGRKEGRFTMAVGHGTRGGTRVLELVDAGDFSRVFRGEVANGMVAMALAGRDVPIKLESGDAGELSIIPRFEGFRVRVNYGTTRETMVNVHLGFEEFGQALAAHASRPCLYEESTI